MTAILFGGTGALGRELQSHIQVRPLSARDRMFQTRYELASDLTTAHADVIFNCAALNGVDPCFHRYAAAKIVNTDWPRLLDSAKYEARLIHFSTEAVFSCETSGKLYGETDRPAPTTLYGQTKRAGECGTLIRLPLLYGPTNGKQIVAKLLRSLMHGETVKIATDLYSTPMYTPDVAAWVVNNIENDHRVLHLASDQRVSLCELVDALAEQVNAPGMIIAAKSADFSSAEPKSLHGGLRSEYVPAFSLDAGIAKYANWINANREAFLNGA